MSSELLNRVKSEKKRSELLAILRAPYPTHWQRVWLAGFLRYAIDLSVGEVCVLIASEHKWADYDPKITRAQVASVRKEGEAQRQVRKGSESVSAASDTDASSSSSANEPHNEYPPLRPLRPGERIIENGDWVGIMNGAGFVFEWWRRR